MDVWVYNFSCLIFYCGVLNIVSIWLFSGYKISHQVSYSELPCIILKAFQFNYYLCFLNNAVSVYLVNNILHSFFL